jgi:hypothetical protein
MDSPEKRKQLLKILVGAAWIDGLIQPEERNYLRRKAEANGLASEPEIKSLLSEIVPIKPEQCYQWLEDYLGKNHSEEDYQALLEAVSALIYSDSDVQAPEAQLLTKLQGLDPALQHPHFVFEKLLKGIQEIYRKAIGQQV